jgi:C4-dicarboxylate-specific signal transduction histidine kinase
MGELGDMCKLLRYFSVMSLLIIVLASLSLGFFYQQKMLHDLIELGESKNVALTVVIGMMLMLTVLYALLLCIVRHADRTIRQQHDALQAAHDELARRVEERTATLNRINAT